MKKDKETSVWLTLLLLVLGVAVVVGLVGLALWYSDKAGIAQPPVAKPSDGWGIATDSPLRNKK
jgi:flagellar basal body-associated protein FliL